MGSDAKFQGDENDDHPGRETTRRVMKAELKLTTGYSGFLFDKHENIIPCVRKVDTHV